MAAGAARAWHAWAMSDPRQVILLVEDDDDIRELMAAVLCDEGYAVCAAENGLRGLELARTTPPALILLDLMMPVMNGWEFRAHQMADEDLAGVPTIVVSAAGADAVVSLRVTAFIPKPLSFDTLLGVIRDHVGSEPSVHQAR